MKCKKCGAEVKYIFDREEQLCICCVEREDESLDSKLEINLNLWLQGKLISETAKAQIIGRLFDRIEKLENEIFARRKNIKEDK